MVESRGGKRPHLVISGKGGQFKCDKDCLNYKSIGICSHTVAVAHINNKLEQFVSWFLRQKEGQVLQKLLFMVCQMVKGKREARHHGEGKNKSHVLLFAGQFEHACARACVRCSRVRVRA